MKENETKVILIPSNDIKAVDRLDGTHTLIRCEKALELWRTGKYHKIITSGGTYYKKSIQTKPAADIMKNWLVSNGISNSDIISENTSLDTYTNIHYSLKSLKEHGIDFKELVVISHWTHLVRIRILLWRNYSIKPSCISVDYRLSILEWLHEIIWFFYYFIDKTGNGFPERMLRKHVKKLSGRFF